MYLTDIKVHLNKILFPRLILQNIFNDIYQHRLWGNSPSFSGSGSDISQTRTISKAIPRLLKKYNIKTILDAPCGDFYWLKRVKLPVKKYIGLDVVPSIISHNKKFYTHSGLKFTIGNIIADPLPKVELILCRDCLVHFSTIDIKRTIRNFQKSGSTYLLTTTFPQHSSNTNISTGSWRPIDLRSPPFNFPQPMETITENCTENGGKYFDKSLSLWKIDDLPQKHKFVLRIPKIYLPKLKVPSN